MPSKDRDLYKEAVITWGSSDQLDRLVEECAELIHAVQKLRRYGRNPDKVENVISEIADVQICLSQMHYVFDTNRINEVQSEKLKKLEKKLDAANNDMPNIYSRDNRKLKPDVQHE